MKRSDLDNFDELFRNSSTNFQLEPTESAWSDISQKLDKKKRRRFFLWLSVASSVLLLISGGIYFSQKNNKEKQFAGNEQSNKQTQNDKLSENQSSNKTKNEELIIDKESTKANSKNNNAIVESNKKEAKNIEIAVTKSNNDNAILNIEKENSNSNKTAQNKDLQTANTSTTTTITKGKRLTSLPDKNQPFPRFTNSEYFAFRKLNQVDRKISSLPIYTENENAETKLIASKSKKKKTSKKSKRVIDGSPWGVAIQLTPEYISSTEKLGDYFYYNEGNFVKSVAVDPAFSSALNTYRHNIGFSAGAKLLYKWNATSGFTLGLNYLNRSENMNYYRNYNEALSPQEILDFKQIKDYNYQYLQYTNKYNSIELPIGYYRDFFKNENSNVSWRNEVQVSPFLIANGKMMAYDFLDNAYFERTFRADQPTNTFGLSASVSSKLKFDLSQNVSFSAGLNYRKGFTSIFQDFYPINKKVNSLGSEFSLIFKL